MNEPSSGPQHDHFVVVHPVSRQEDIRRATVGIRVVQEILAASRRRSSPHRRNLDLHHGGTQSSSLLIVTTAWRPQSPRWSAIQVDEERLLRLALDVAFTDTVIVALVTLSGRTPSHPGLVVVVRRRRRPVRGGKFTVVATGDALGATDGASAPPASCRCSPPSLDVVDCDPRRRVVVHDRPLPTLGVPKVAFTGLDS